MAEYPPKGITYREEFEPDMERMVKALRIVFENMPEEQQEQVPNMREAKAKAEKVS